MMALFLKAVLVIAYSGSIFLLGRLAGRSLEGGGSKPMVPHHDVTRIPASWQNRENG